MGNKDSGETSGNSLQVNLGQEIDAALGDVIRGLLMKPASALGDLASDAIGLVGDRIKRKRELNVELGLTKVREKLEADKVDIEDIIPPTEEDLHLLINGLSLNDDANLQDLWVGLFAKALEPDSTVTAERPFVSVLQSMSPMDARIVDFLAFTLNTDSLLQKNFVKFSPNNYADITPQEKRKIEEANEKNAALRKQAIDTIQVRAEEYKLNSLSGSAWSDNLLRQGVIERTPLREPSFGPLRMHSLDERELLRFLDSVNRKMSHLEQAAKRSSSSPGTLFSKVTFSPAIALEIQLTGFGTRFAQACGLFDMPHHE